MERPLCSFMVLIKMLVTAAGLRPLALHISEPFCLLLSAPGRSETNLGAVLCAPAPSRPLPVWLQALLSLPLTFLSAPLPSAPSTCPLPCPTTTGRQCDPIKHNKSHPISCFKNRHALAWAFSDPWVPPLVLPPHGSPPPAATPPQHWLQSLSSDCRLLALPPAMHPPQPSFKRD